MGARHPASRGRLGPQQHRRKFTQVAAKRRSQARGAIRREKLLAAARRLLSQHAIQKVTYQDIANEAGMPLSSCYRFYSGKWGLIGALAEQLAPEFRQAVLRRFDADSIEHWHDLIDAFVDRSCNYFRDNRAARQILIGGRVSPEIKLAARSRERGIACHLRAVLDAFFVLPDVPDSDRIFFYAVEFADLALCLSEIEHEHLSDWSIEEAKRVLKAYLGLYLATHLQRRETMLDFA